MLDERSIKMKLISNCPIYIEGLGNLHTLTLKEIADFGETNYFKMLGLLFGDFENLSIQNPMFTYFEYIFMICCQNIDLKKELLDFFSLIFKENISMMMHDTSFFIGNFHEEIPANKVCSLDKNNFEDFLSILRIQNGLKENKKNKNDKSKENSKVLRLKKLREKGRKDLAKAKGDDFSLENMISTLGVFYLDIDKVLSLNIYQASNQYEKLMRQEKYRNLYDVYIAGGDPDKLGLNKHWSLPFRRDLNEMEAPPEVLKF